MANMSYCRFENTESDFLDCIWALEDIMGNEKNDLSEYEIKAAQRMRELCDRYIDLFDDLEEGGLI